MLNTSYGEMSGHQSCKKLHFFLFLKFHLMISVVHIDVIVLCELSVIRFYKIFKNTGY